MSSSVHYRSMSLDGLIAGPNDAPGNPGGGDFMRLHKCGCGELLSFAPVMIEIRL